MASRLDTNKSPAHLGMRHAWLSKRVGYSRQVRSSEQTECQLNFAYVFKGKTEGLSCVLFGGLEFSSAGPYEGGILHSEGIAPLA